MNGLGLEILAGLGLFLGSLFIHEAAHLTVLKRHYPSALLVYDGSEFRVGDNWMYAALSADDKGKVYAAGVFAGLFPLLGGLFVINNLVVIFFFIIYVIGSAHDIKMIMNCLKKG